MNYDVQMQPQRQPKRMLGPAVAAAAAVEMKEEPGPQRIPVITGIFPRDSKWLKKQKKWKRRRRNIPPSRTTVEPSETEEKEEINESQKIITTRLQHLQMRESPLLEERREIEGEDDSSQDTIPLEQRMCGVTSAQNQEMTHRSPSAKTGNKSQPVLEASASSGGTTHEMTHRENKSYLASEASASSEGTAHPSKGDEEKQEKATKKGSARKLSAQAQRWRQWKAQQKSQEATEGAEVPEPGS